VTWGAALDAWRVKLQSDTTRATYCGQVRAFFTVPGVPRELAALDVELLDAYAGALRMRASKDAPPADRLAPATVNLKLAALRSFLSFARRRGWLSPLLSGEAISDALEGLRSQVQRPYQIVEGDELGDLLTAAGEDRYDAPRALALVGLMLGAGLRIAELVSLDVGDLASDATGCYVDVRAGKGNKQRQVPIAQDVYELVSAYLAATGRAVHRTADRGTPLFLSRKCRGGAGRLTTRQARRITVACATRAGLSSRKRITPHALRHSYALDVLAGDPEQGRAGAPLPAVSKLLGHSSVAVTGRYLAHFERRDLGAFAPSLRRA
jgi:integrase/recombinase XerC